MRNRPRLTTVAALAAVTALMAACHTSATVAAPAAAATTAGAPSAPGSADPPASAAPSDVAPGGGSDAGAGPASTTTVRIANFFAPKGQPGPGLDIYDVALQGQAATPILTDVAYGTVSTYVQPHQLANNIAKAVQLTALPTSEDPVAQKGDASQIGGLIDDNSGAQATIVLTAGNDDPLGSATSLLGVLSESIRMEKGDDGQGFKGPAAPAITSGGGEILVDETALPDNLNPSLYLMIDNSCAPPINGDPNMKGLPLVFNAAGGSIESAFAVFATTVGSHQVSVVSWKSVDTPTCKQLTKRQAPTTVAVAAGQQVALYVYGSTLDALRIAMAPIQP